MFYGSVRSKIYNQVLLISLICLTFYSNHCHSVSRNLRWGMRVSTKRDGNDTIRRPFSSLEPAAAPNNFPLQRMKSVIMKRQIRKRQKPVGNHFNDMQESSSFTREHSPLNNDDTNLSHALKNQQVLLPNSESTHGDLSTSFGTARGITVVPSNQYFASGLTVPSVLKYVEVPTTLHRERLTTQRPPSSAGKQENKF